MTPLPPIKARGVAVIGGGRWARVHASVLRQVLPADGSVIAAAISPTNPAVWQDALTWPHWRVAPSVQDVLADPVISHVIIARQARDHAATALDCLASGKSVLVEKPFCLTLDDAQKMTEAAQGRCCAVGHVFAYARNIVRFREACLARGKVTTLTLLWGDPALEARYGAKKSFDLSLNVVQDVLPHAWSVLRPFLPDQTPLSVTGVQSELGGARVQLVLQSGDVRLQVTVSRSHPERCRQLTVEGADWCGQLDFSAEPGTAVLDGAPVDVATGFVSPLEAEVRAFLADAPLPETQIPTAREAVTLSAQAMAVIRAQQAQVLRQSDPRDTAFQTALREIRLGGLRGDGIAASSGAIADWAGVADQKLQPLPGDLPS